MPRIVTNTVYAFDELSEKAKNKALTDLVYINVDYDWWDAVYEDAANIGLKIEEFDIGRGSYVEAEVLTSHQDIAETILKEHGENTSTYILAKTFLDEYEALLKEHTDQEGELSEAGELEIARIEDEFNYSLRNEYLNILRREYEYLTSDEAIMETIEANAYEFTEDGELYA